MTLTVTEAVILLLLLVCAGLLTAVLVSLRRQDARREKEAGRQEQLQNQIADEVLDALDGQKQEVRQALRDSDAARGQAAQAASAQLGAMLETVGQLDSRMEQLRQGVTGGITQLRQENERQLGEMRRTVDEKLTASLDKRLGESFSQVSRRLEQVWKGLGEMQSLAAGVGDLRKVLTNVKNRGIWGEMQLGALLESMLAPGQYEANACIVPGSQERVEYAIRLPGRDSGTVYLPIDSKFPQEDYIRLQEALDSGDPVRAEESRRALAARLRTEARRIAAKYIAPPHSTDFAIMFLPVEGLYAEAVRSSGLTEAIQREYRVTLAGPSTFSALLNALQMGFRTLAIEQRSGEVWRLLSEVKGDFARFAETLEKTRQRLQQASESIDTAVSRTQSIQRRLSRVEESAGLPGEDADAE